MASLFRGMSNWLRPVLARPIVANCLNLVRDFANQRHKKVIKLAKGKLVFMDLCIYLCIYLCMYVYMHLCICIYIYIYI
jgi:hypothetical protein